MKFKTSFFKILQRNSLKFQENLQENLQDLHQPNFLFLLAADEKTKRRRKKMDYRTIFLWPKNLKKFENIPKNFRQIFTGVIRISGI